MAVVVAAELPVAEHARHAALAQGLPRREGRHAGHAQAGRRGLHAHLAVVGDVAAMHRHLHVVLAGAAEAPVVVALVLAQRQAAVGREVARVRDGRMALEVGGRGHQDVRHRHQPACHQPLGRLGGEPHHEVHALADRIDVAVFHDQLHVDRRMAREEVQHQRMQHPAREGTRRAQPHQPARFGREALRQRHRVLRRGRQFAAALEGLGTGLGQAQLARRALQAAARRSPSRAASPAGSRPRA